MNNNEFYATVLLLLLLLMDSGFGQQRIDSNAESQTLTTFTEVRGQPEFMPSSFEFSTSRYTYRISSIGRGRRTGYRTATRSFNLSLHRGYTLESSVYHAEYQGDVLLVCEVSNGDGGAGFITRLDARTLRLKWKRWIPAFNVGQGLIEDDFAYITAHGFVGKVDLRSGAFLWKHDGLYRGHDLFNAFELPRIEGEAVLFKENAIYNSPARTIKVHRRTGKLISII